MGDYGPAEPLVNAQTTQTASFASTDQEDISVLVTGFGPFKYFRVNASHLIASSLPPSLSYANEQSSAPRQISIHAHPAPISGAFSAIRTTVPALMEDFAKAHGGRRPDIIIHMGIAATRNYYSVELQAHRDAYHMSDNLGRAGYEDGEKLWRELELPPLLKPGPVADYKLPTTAAIPTNPESLLSKIARTQMKSHPPDEEFLSTWRTFAPAQADLRISEEAGRYLCEFIYYTSLSLAYQEKRDRNVIFLHVPASCASQDIQTGTEVTIALIKTLVARWIEGKL